MKNNNRLKVDVINYGATLVSIEVPDKAGKIDDVITGFDTLTGTVCGMKHIQTLVISNTTVMLGQSCQANVWS